MMNSFFKIARSIGAVAIFVIYALLVHHVNTAPAGVHQNSLLGAVLVLIPIFLTVITYALKCKSTLTGVSVVGVFCITAWFLWPLIQLHTGFIFWLLDIGLMMALLITFGRTLLQDRKPLCVFFAEIINGGVLPADHEIYARKVTIAWVMFFAMIIIVSTLLFFLAPLPVWSFFVNFLTLPLVALMLAGEFFARKRLLTNLPESNVMDAVRAYMDKSAHIP